MGKVWAAGSIYSTDMVDKVMTDIPGGMEQDGLRFHPATQNSAQFKTYEYLLLEFSL